MGDTVSELKVYMTKRPFRGTRKAFVRLEEEKALILLKANHFKIRWVSCRGRRKTEINRCYRCLGFGHMAENCWGPDRSTSCLSCGEEEHIAGSCLRKPRCYLCTAREVKPWDDHIPGAMWCVAFREAAPKWKPWEAANKGQAGK